MLTRKITADIVYGSMTDLKPGRFAKFSVTSDTGPVSGVIITAARLHVSLYRSYSTSYKLQVKYDASSGETLASTTAMQVNNAEHSETLTLGNWLPDLVKLTPENIYLVVQASGTTNKCNFRDGCTITLEIDYMYPPELIAYTDPIITAGVTQVKAAHINELQVNITLIREALSLPRWPFTTVRAQYTSIGGWNDHITEMRAAIDEMTTNHEDWLELGDNCPRADVLEQMRRVVEVASNLTEVEGGNG